jgi:hypothetical protein
MRVLLAFATLLMTCLPAAATTGWEEVKNQGGIRIYTKETVGSPFLATKGTCIIEADVEAILTTLDDNGSRPSWIPFLLESKRLKTFSQNERLEYSIFRAPWPVSNRDFVFRAKATPDKDNGVIVFSMKSEPSSLMPEQEGLVRGVLLESTFILKALTPTQTQVEMHFHADPKGWIPAWATNIIQRTWPYFVLKGMREEVLARHTPKSD